MAALRTHAPPRHPQRQGDDYLDKSTPYFDVPLPDPSSAASNDTLPSPAACATLSALAPELNTTAATTIKGGSGADVLAAATGTTADVLSGGAGNDVLVSNAGLTTLTGGEGADVFRIATASLNVNSYSTVTDFAAGDLLQIAGIGSFAAADADSGERIPLPALCVSRLAACETETVWHRLRLVYGALWRVALYD